MKITSKIKTLFSLQTIHDLAAICDTRRIASNIEKMKLVMKVLVAVRDDVLQIGGATNRLVVQLEGYIVKIALDSQGFEDNMMEFSLAEELAGDTTKTYETNGYLLVAQLARLMTKEEWYQRKGDILRKLERLSKDYLLGDVGYDELNRTNWGILDNDEVVILDYAYIHRATEKLFTCPECEDGTLTYDQYYTQLMCSNMAHCKAKYTYSEMKKIQGSKVDEDMIAEKIATSIVLKGNQVDHEVKRIRDGDIVDEDTVIIHNNLEYERFLEEERIGRVDRPVSIKELEKLEARMATSDHPNEEYMIWVEQQKNQKPVKRKFVLADDYYEISKEVIHPKWIGMNYGETHEEFLERLERIKKEQSEGGREMLDLTRKPSQFGGGITIMGDGREEETKDRLETSEGVFYGDPRPEPNTGNRNSRDADDDRVFLGLRDPGRKRKGKLFLGQPGSGRPRPAATRNEDGGATYEVRKAMDLYTNECMRLVRIINNSDDEEEVARAQNELDQVKEAGYEKYLDTVKAESDGNRRNDNRRDNNQNQNRQNNQNNQRRNNQNPGFRRDRDNNQRDNNQNRPNQNNQRPAEDAKPEPKAEPPKAQQPAPQPKSEPVEPKQEPVKEEPKASAPQTELASEPQVNTTAKKSKYGAILSSDEEYSVNVQSLTVDGKEV